MSKKRGGGRGRGGGQGPGKRKATTPVGGVYKDSRRNINGEEDYDDEEDWTLVISNKQKSPARQTNQTSEQRAAESSTTGMSFADAVAGAGASTSARRDSNASQRRMEGGESGGRGNKNFVSKFVTPPPQGSMRDEIVIEIQRINGAKFIGQLGFKEAKYGIFRECLDLDPTLIHGLRFGYSDFPVIKFKLKDKIDVDALIAKELFTYKRQFMVGNQLKTDEVDCKIRGLRAPGQARPADADPSVRWVKVEWAEYSLQKEQMMEWLERYGEKAGDLSEDIHPDSDSDDSPIGSGTYSVKMKLRKDIPQLIPMFGKRIRIYYRGVQKLCTKCFGKHSRLHCRNDKVRWIDYVLRFMEENPDIPERLYGRWWQVVNEEFGQVTSEIDETEEVQETASDVRRPEHRIEEETSYGQVDKNQHHVSGNQAKAVPTQKGQTLSRKEEEDLADYLGIGLSITEAREMRRKENELAEMKLRIRESKRAVNRGAIETQSSRSETRVGPWGMPSRRGGLSFN